MAWLSYLGGLTKTMEVIEDGENPGLDYNQVPLEVKSRLLTLDSLFSEKNTELSFVDLALRQITSLLSDEYQGPFTQG
jgi:hypothetical protein